jgi:integrase
MSIHEYKTKTQGVRYVVHLREGGRGSKRITKYGFRTKTEAKHWQTQAMADLQNGERIVIKSKKLKDYLEEWVEIKKRKVGVSQYKRINQHLAHIIPFLGHKKIDALTELDVYRLRDAKQKDGLAKRTIRAMEFCLKGALDYTVGNRPNDFLRQNPLLKLDVLQVRKGDEKAIEVLEVDEQKILLAEARKYAQEHDPRWFMRPFLGLHTGARSGEIAGLQWGDINWEHCTLNINKAVHYGNGDTKPEIKETKTNEDRTISLDKTVMEELRQYKMWCSERLLKGGVRLKDDMHILFDSDLGPLHESAPMSRWKTILRRANLKYRGFHCLRHTHASNLIAEDINLKLISERLGHKSIQITMDRYGHLLKKTDESMRNALEAMQTQLNMTPT